MPPPPPAHPEPLREIAVDGDGPGFDQNLPGRHVQGFDDAAELLYLRSGSGEDDGVGALVDQGAALVGGPGILLGGGVEQGPQVRSPGIADLNVFCAHWGELLHPLLILQPLLFRCGDFRRRGDQQDAAELAMVQALGLQNQLQRLAPGHRFEMQRDAAGHGIAGHQVEAGEVRNDLQRRPHFDVLKIEGKSLAFVCGRRDRPFGKGLAGDCGKHQECGCDLHGVASRGVAASVRCRRTQPPPPSATTSTSSIEASAMRWMRP